MSPNPVPTCCAPTLLLPLLVLALVYDVACSGEFQSRPPG